MATGTLSPAIPTLDLQGAAAIPAPLTPRQLIWRRFRRHRMALAGSIGVVLLLVFIVVGSIAVPEATANSGDLRARLLPPNAQHWFGTDSTGRDAFSRIIYGGQISLLIG